MTGEERRIKIIAELEKAKVPVSASAFAKKFTVSRQIIVGDIALLRAAGFAVRATSKGYVLVNDQQSDYHGKVVCQHQPAQTAAELTLIVSLGASVIDVAVEHEFYGELVGNLDIKTKSDVQNFVKVIEQGKVRLLSDLTGGIHIHTIGCRDQQHFSEVEQALAENGFLYKD